MKPYATKRHNNGSTRVMSWCESAAAPPLRPLGLRNPSGIPWLEYQIDVEQCALARSDGEETISILDRLRSHFGFGTLMTKRFQFIVNPGILLDPKGRTFSLLSAPLARSFNTLEEWYSDDRLLGNIFRALLWEDRLACRLTYYRHIGVVSIIPWITSLEVLIWIPASKTTVTQVMDCAVAARIP